MADTLTEQPAASSGPTEQADGATAHPDRWYPLDAFRGLAVVLMIFVNWAGNYSLPTQFGHSEWNGLTLADTVFPAFLVAVGTALPYASRTGWRRAWGRAIMLFLIGCALVSFKYRQPFSLSVGVLQLTAVAYLVVWLLTRLPRRAQVVVAVVTLTAISIAYLFASPPGVVAGSFEQGTTLGEGIDAWLGLPPHPENPHAWLPAAGSVFIGVLAGWISQTSRGRDRLVRLSALGLSLLLAGLLVSSVIPVNKYLWTPSFVLVTGGLSVLTLVVMALLVPASSRGGILRPLVIVGGQAIVVYAVSETVIGRAHDEWLWPTLEPTVTERYGELAGGVAFPLGAVLACVLLAWVMEVLKIRVRV